MRKIRIVSDLHIEFDFGTKVPKQTPRHQYHLDVMEDEKETILILAGDICVVYKFKNYRYFFEDVNNRFHSVIFILGNHEYYHGNYPTVIKHLEDGLEGLNNVHLLDDSDVVIDGIHFIGGTLWTSFDSGEPLCVWDAQQKMNDYKCIRTGSKAEPWKRKLRPADTIHAHRVTKKYIFETVNNSSHDKIVVVSHHAPSAQSIDSRYKQDRQNPAYYTELSYDIMGTTNNIDLWVHGHMHSSNDYMIENTHVIANPRGYFRKEMNPNYDNTLTVTL